MKITPAAQGEAAEANPYSPPTEVHASHWRLTYCRIALGAFYAFMATGTIAGREHRGLEDLSALGAGAALLLWCTLDAPRHGKEFFHGLAVPFFATCPITIAFYLLWTRGWSGLLSYAKSAALAMAIALGAYLLAHGHELLTVLS